MYMKRNRCVVPTSIRNEILESIQDRHQNIMKYRNCAKSSVWWPGVSRHALNLSKNRPEKRKETLTPTQLLNLPYFK